MPELEPSTSPFMKAMMRCSNSPPSAWADMSSEVIRQPVGRVACADHLVPERFDHNRPLHPPQWTQVAGLTWCQGLSEGRQPSGLSDDDVRILSMFQALIESISQISLESAFHRGGEGSCELAASQRVICSGSRTTSPAASH